MRMIFTILFMACLIIAIDSNDRFLINQVFADTDQHDHADDHDDHEDDYDDHEGENETTIHPDAAKRAGIATDQVSSETLHKQIVLTGRVMLNRDKTYAVRARFPGILKTVKVRWGQQVEKGQVLATVESNDSLLTYSIYAPRSGVVLERNTNVGDVANDEALFMIADLKTMWAEFHIFPSDLGMIIEGHVEVSEKVADLVVRENAIQTLNEKSIVFIKENETTYVPREVELGESDGDYVEVLTGLQQGEVYVAKGSYRIKADLLKSTAEHEH